MKIQDAIAMAVSGKNAKEGAKVDGHSFFIRSVKNKNRLKGDETSYFRHEHAGKDDRVFYTVKLGDKKGEYSAKLTRIQFRGPLVKNGFRDIGDHGIDVTDAVKLLKAAPGGWGSLAKAAKELDVQGFLDGDWVPAAAKVVDMIGQRMAAKR
ncbi:MAG: hypothetical protein ACK2UO_19635 [Caldilineaceae bacterium]|jgi:YHS domain-containing protein